MDVGVAATDAQHAGEDCTETMRSSKVGRYAPFLAELQAAHIAYRPMVWSCFGREHSDTTSTMVSLARRAARRRGFADYRPLLARARAAIGVALARRLAQMALSCQARLSFGLRAFLS